MEAEADIPSNTVWWTPTASNTFKLYRGQWKGFMLSEIDRSEMSRKTKEAFMAFTYYSKKDDCLYFVGDSTRFIKHSSEPNSKLTPEGRVSLRSIKKGEPITEDFSQYDKYPWPEQWERDCHASAEEKKDYLLSHPEDPHVFSKEFENLKHYVAKAGDKGLGLFCGQDQKKGGIWWAETPCNLLRLTKLFWLTFVPTVKTPTCQGFHDSVLFYCYYHRPSDALIYCLDDARFTNHSRTPNTTVDDKNLYSIFRHDVPAGSEVDDDYRDYESDCPWTKFLWEDYL